MGTDQIYRLIVFLIHMNPNLYAISIPSGLSFILKMYFTLKMFGMTTLHVRQFTRTKYEAVLYQ